MSPITPIITIKGKLKIRYIGIFILLLNFYSVAQDTNLIKNPGFENGAAPLPDYWSVALWDRKPETTQISWQQGNAHSGKKCMVIDSLSRNDARLTQAVQVQVNKIYKFSCWIKTENIGDNALGACISVIGLMDTAGNLHGTNNAWQEVTAYIRVELDIAFLEIGLGVGGYASLNTGKAMFDDVSLYEVDAVPENQFKVIVLKKSDTKTAETSSIETVNMNYKVKTGMEVYLMLLFFIVIFGLVILFAFTRANPLLWQNFLDKFRKKPEPEPQATISNTDNNPVDNAATVPENTNGNPADIAEITTEKTDDTELKEKK